MKSTRTPNGFTSTSGSRWEVSHQKKEVDRKRSEHAARTTYVLCRSSRRVLTLFCQSLKSLSTSRSALLSDFPHRNQPHTFANQVRSCKTRKLKRKNQTNPPKHERKKKKEREALLFLDPVSTRRTGTETRGAERNGHPRLSPSPCALGVWFLEQRRGMG